MGRAASHVTLECALQTHPQLALICEEVAAHRWGLKDVVRQVGGWWVGGWVGGLKMQTCTYMCVRVAQESPAGEAAQQPDSGGCSSAV